MKPLRIDSKAAAILSALHGEDGLTAAAAFALGETDLAGTIAHLKRSGHSITAEWRRGVSRYNRPTRFKIYRVTTPTT